MDEPLRHLDDGDFAAETSEHLPEFETDVAAADDDQVPGNEVELHHRAVGEVLDLLEARQPRHGGAAADVDEDPLRREPVCIETHRVPRLEAGVGAIDRAPLHGLQPGLDADPRLTRDRVLAGLHTLHVDGCGANVHAEVARAADHVGGIGARHQGLRRDAAGVHAGAAERAALDDRDAHARARQTVRQERAGLAGADDDRVVRGGHPRARRARRTSFPVN